MKGTGGVDVVFSEDCTEAVLTYKATNTTTALFFSVFPGLFGLMFFALGIAAIANGRIDLAALFFLCCVGVVLAIRWLFWRLKTYRIRFSADGLEAGGQTFAYDDIASFGVASLGGDAYDPASMPMPRNTTVGPHLYIIQKSDPRPKPITVGMPLTRVRAVAEAFGATLSRFS